MLNDEVFYHQHDSNDSTILDFYGLSMTVTVRNVSKSSIVSKTKWLGVTLHETDEPVFYNNEWWANAQRRYQKRKCQLSEQRIAELDRLVYTFHGRIMKLIIVGNGGRAGRNRKHYPRNTRINKRVSSAIHSTHIKESCPCFVCFVVANAQKFTICTFSKL